MNLQPTPPQPFHRTRHWICAGLLAALGSSAIAAPRTWTTGDGGDGLWSNTANWGGLTFTSGDTATFGATNGTTILNNDLTLTSLSSITFTAAAPAYTISGNILGTSGTLGLGSIVVNSAPGVTQTLNLNVDGLSNSGPVITGAGDLAYGGTLTRRGGLASMTMNGTGTLTFSGSSNFSPGSNVFLNVNSGTTVLNRTAGAMNAGINLNGGTLTLAADEQLKTVSILNINGGTLDLNGFDSNVNGGGTGVAIGTNGATGGIGLLTGLGGLITNNAAGTGTNWLVINQSTGSRGSYGGTISDGATAKVGVSVMANYNQAAFQVLAGNNTYSGGTYLQHLYTGANGRAETLSIGNVASIGSFGSRNLTFKGASTNPDVILQLTGTAVNNSNQFDGLTFTSGLGAGIDVADPTNTFTLGKNAGGTDIAMTGNGSFEKLGAGTLVITSGSLAYTGATFIGGGTLKIDAQQGGALASSSRPTFAGGDLYLLGKTSGTTTQTLGNVSLGQIASSAYTSGANKITVDANGGAGTTLALGTLGNPTAAGSTLNIKVGTNATVTTTTTSVTNGLLGIGRFVFTDASDVVDFATISASGSPRTVQAATYTSGLPTSGSTATVNYSQTDNATVTASESINSLKLTTSTTGQSLAITSGQTLTLTSGGLLFTGSDDYSITGGTLKSNTASNSDLIIHHYGTGELTIGSVISNGNGNSTLTKAGTGTLVLGATNTYTGQTWVTGGILSVSNNNQLGAVATGAQVNLVSGGVLQWNEATSGTLDNGGANKRNIVIGSGGGGFEVAASGTLTISGGITGHGMMTKSGAGTLVLGAGNSLLGGLTINDGTVKQNVANSLTNSNSSTATSNLIFGSGSTARLQLNNFDAAVTSLVSSNANAIVENGGGSATRTLTVMNGADNTYAGILQNGSSGVLALAKSGGGTLTLSNASNTFSGGATIYNGTLEGTQTGTLGTGAITLADGTLKAAGSFTNAIASLANLSNNGAYTTSYLNNTIDTSAGDASFSGVFSGSGAVNKTGANTLTLSHSSNTFTGTLTSTSGTVSFASLNSAASLVMAGGDFTSTAATTVAAIAVNSTGTVTTTASNLTANSLSGSGTLNARTTGFGNGLRLAGSSNSGFSGSINVGIATGFYATLYLAHEDLLGTNPDALSFNTAGGSGLLYDNGSPLSIASHRISLTGGNTLFLLGQNATGDMSITGGITGAGSVGIRSQTTKAIVIGGTNNDYTGDTRIYTDNAANSTLRLSGDNALPSGTGKGNLNLHASGTGTATFDLAGYDQTVNGLTSTGASASSTRIIDIVSAGGNSTLTVGANNANGYTFAGVIQNTTGTVNLVKTGTGTQTLTGNNLYTGNTIVAEGAFIINGDQSSATGNVTVASGATLGGGGTIGGNTAIASGATLTGGTSGTVDTLNFANGLTASSGSIWLIDLVQATSMMSDQINITGGNVDISGSTLQLNFLDSPAIPGNTYHIATYSGLSSAFTSTFNGLAEGDIISGYQIHYGGGTTGFISLTAVPEPGTLGLLGLAISGFFFRRIRRLRAE